MKRYKLIISSGTLVSVLLAALLLAIYCSYDNLKSKNTKVKIGFSMATLLEERWQRDRDIVVADAKQAGADIIVDQADNSVKEQLNQVEEMLSQGISVLLIVPVDYKIEEVAVTMAKKKGVKVICYDRLIGCSDTDLYVAFDNVKIGELMGKAMAGLLKKGNCIIVNGSPDDHNSYMFNKGYKGVLSKYKGIRVASETWADAWSTDEANNFVENALDADYKVSGIIAANDNLAGAAINVLEEHRLAGKVPVVGGDADLAACQRIAEGTQLATIYKPIDELASEAVKACIALSRGQRIKTYFRISDGKNKIPAILVNPVLVEKANLKDTVVKSGFHSYEDVYRNVKR